MKYALRIDEATEVVPCDGDSPSRFLSRVLSLKVLTLVRAFIVDSMQDIFDEMVATMLLDEIKFDVDDTVQITVDAFSHEKNGALARLAAKSTIAWPWKDCHVFLVLAYDARTQSHHSLINSNQFNMKSRGWVRFEIDKQTIVLCCLLVSGFCIGHR